MPTSKTAARRASAPAAKPARPKAAARRDAPRERMTLAQAMEALEAAGSAQTRKTYARHGVSGPMFGVSFATIATLVKRIGVDHELARELWTTGNFDARNLALKVADPAQMSPTDLDRWQEGTTARMCGGYVAMLAVEGPHGRATAERWLASPDESRRCAGWGVVAQLAARDAAVPDAWLVAHLAEIRQGLQRAPNDERHAMNHALIALGGRSPALRDAALAAAKSIGKVEVDHGDTSCKTPDAAAYVVKTWAHAKAKGFATPSAQEQTRQAPRTRW
jgi:3-methyladenine DNA glycosylase AlkD